MEDDYLETKDIILENPEDFINPVYYEYMLSNNNPVQIYYGGSSSGKSHAIAQRVIIDVLQGRNYLIVRKTGDSLRRSTFNEVVSKLYDLNVADYFNVNKADMIITCKLHNRQIMFRGLDDVEKLKSIKPLNGVITDIWLEEATECSYNDYKQLDKRLRGRTEFVKRIMFSFNPIVKSHWIYEEFFKDRWDNTKQYVESDGVSILKTTYRDNKFLAEDDVARLEAEKDPYYRMVYLEGEWGVLKGVVYENWEVKDFDKEAFDQYRVGVDWGFACLSGETLVDTELGKKKLKDIKIGDKVLTRQGFRKVIYTQCTGQKEVYAIDFGNKKSIIATGDHRIFTASGWKRVDELQELETLCVNKSNLMAKFIKKLLGNGQLNILDVKRKESWFIYIEKFGNFIMEKFQKGASFIIKTLTRSITRLKTWFALHNVNIQNCIIQKNLSILSLKRHVIELNILKRIGKNAEKNQLKQHKKEEEFVKSAGCLTRLLTFTKNTVRQLVEKEPILGTVKRSISAKYVESRLWLQRIINAQPVQKNVRIKRRLLSQKKEVFDITVENGEFFANGILVHNCDPFACIRVAIDIRRRELWVCDEIYKKGMLNDESIPLVKKLARGSVVWCDSAEPKSIVEYRSRGINAYGVRKGQGSIEQGINFIKRFHIYVHPSCKHTQDELSSYRYREDSRTGNILPEPVDKDNHLCVAKGTLIKTNKGNIAIENIKEGDYVLTRAGYKKVLAASKTGENVKTKTLITKKGNILFATHNHKIYNYYENRFLPLDTLRYGDKILICKGNVSYIRVKSGIVIQNLKKIIDILRRAINIYIIKYLKIITGNVRKAIIYIIKTVIRLITTPIILLKLVLKSTQLFIIRKIEKHLPENIYLKFQNWQKHGTNLKKEENGTESTRKNKVLGNIKSRKRSVKIAVKHILQKQPIKSFVMRHVRQNIEESIKLILSKKYAQFVVPLLGQISIEGETLAPDSVRCVLDGSESDVYNLTIEDAHEYFANGILVKNCDALRYALERDARMRGTIKQGL